MHSALFNAPCSKMGHVDPSVIKDHLKNLSSSNNLKSPYFTCLFLLFSLFSVLLSLYSPCLSLQIPFCTLIPSSHSFLNFHQAAAKNVFKTISKILAPCLKEKLKSFMELLSAVKRAHLLSLAYLHWYLRMLLNVPLMLQLNPPVLLVKTSTLLSKLPHTYTPQGKIREAQVSQAALQGGPTGHIRAALLH